MIGFLLRAVATLMVMAGVSALAAGLAALPVLSEGSHARPIVAIIYQMAAVSLAGGLISTYLLRTRRALFLNERASLSSGAQTEVGGWLFAMAVGLAGLPVWMLLNVRDFLTEWRGLIELSVTSTMWHESGASAGGWVLLPILAALTPPFIELLTVVAFVLASTSSLFLLTSRKRTFPRYYAVWMVLLAALVVVSFRGAAGSSLVGHVVEGAFARSDRDAAEAAPVLEFLRRYLSLVTATATVLVWTLCGYLVWLPLVLFSGRVRSTFQR